ncbi:hypothetical protein [Streptomyces longisporus]|uniref:Uncharacterized protein n=1 Tax=Streptomyces longisporus TaxID=1948 RepID=A0ABN3LBG0_STRLO
MPIAEIGLAILSMGAEQLVQWRYGPVGIVALLLLGLGLKARNSTCASVGAVMLLLLMIPS